MNVDDQKYSTSLLSKGLKQEVMVVGHKDGLQKLFMEIFFVMLFLPLTIYTFFTPGLELFFASFVVPLIIFSVGAAISTYYYFFHVSLQKPSQR